jgi:Do/DeqQ family serine protease
MNQTPRLSSNDRRAWTRRIGVTFAALATTATIAGPAWTLREPVAAAAPQTAAASPAVRSTGSGLTSYADLVERVSPAVVTVRARRSVHRTAGGQEVPDVLRRFFEEVPGMRPEPRREAGLGSGVIVSRNGYILTNHHVVDSADRVEIELTDGRRFDAKVVGSDQPSDLAVLKVEAANLQALEFADSDRARVGDVVLAVGNPLGLGQTVTSGIISAKGRETGASEGAFEDFLQTDAPINRGNSGGALVNTSGQLLGINSQILSPSGYSIGIGFAIPANMASQVMSQLVETGKVRRGLLGVTVQRVTSDLARSLDLSTVGGAIVTGVTPGSAAERAGIRQGDVIRSLDGKPVDSSNSLRNAVARAKPGTSVTLSVNRDGKPRDIAVTLGEKEAERTDASEPAGERSGGRYGLTVEPLTPELARRLRVKGSTGLVVSDVDPDSPAADAGLRPGDVIEAIDRKPVADADELRTALDGATASKPALVLVNRQGSAVFLTISAD